jgi:hypothetical protein
MWVIGTRKIRKGNTMGKYKKIWNKEKTKEIRNW